MIPEDVVLIDTHIWIWWVNGDAALRPEHKAQLEQAAQVRVSIISCWEVAKLVENGRLVLSMPVGEWIASALAYPNIELVPLTPEIAVESTRLPGDFHKDPADQIIVASARITGCTLMIVDERIVRYSHVPTI